MFHSALLAVAVLTAHPQTQPATNTTDPVCKMTVDAQTGQTVTVRGREYRVCSKACADALQKDPDKYLDRDGNPRASHDETKPHQHE
ncbi:YHS domain-containing protein [Geothrix sp. 21YS21S-4]|uniref:YHS domain-containing protein n=1 Tax=Geothrix sp. 21YS21S-4 TaxID=3068889 RepID=UPI0027BA3F6D|nr:YHS domain-containing protein [Geothrix sp. 21YS21S-4]